MVVGSFEIIGKSTWLRRTLSDFWPYWQNSKAKFSLTFVALSDLQYETSYSYSIRYPNNEKDTFYEIKLPPMKDREKRSYKTIPFIMWYTGDAFINVRETHSPLLERPVNTFHITGRNWMGLAIAAGSLAGIFSGLFSTLGIMILDALESKI